jgi:hypothetical protein
MIRTQRKRGPSIREQIRSKLANTVIDGGEFGPEAKPEAAAEPSAQLGRPPVHDWFRIAVENVGSFPVKASGGNSNGTIFSPRCRRGAKMSLALRRHGMS